MEEINLNDSTVPVREMEISEISVRQITVEEMLDDIMLYNLSVQELANMKEKELQEIITDDIRARMKEVEEKYNQRIEELKEKTKVVELLVSDIVLIKQSTQCGTITTKDGRVLGAIYNKGRTTWDGKKLEGMVALIPEIAAARKIGDPYVTYREL